MAMPNPTPIFRMVHIESLDTILRRGGMHGTNHVPDDGLPYRMIHNVEIQNKRHMRAISKGPGGTMHDYVPFYFGPRSPMLLQIKSGRVPVVSGGQPSLIYLVTTVQQVAAKNLQWVFSDGHGIALFTEWFDQIEDLSKVDWDAVYAERWKDTVDDMDRQRKKQAEFLVHRFCPWEVIQEIGVYNHWAYTCVRDILKSFDVGMIRPINPKPEWYY